MDASQIASNEIAVLLTGNNIYHTYKEQWQFLLESYMGGDEYRQAGHLMRYQLESNSEYWSRIQNTPLENHCKSIIQTYTSFLFRVAPTRELGTYENNIQVQDFLRDCDHDDRSLDQFMRDVAVWSSVFGNVWVVMAKPDIGALSLADEVAAGARPYVNMITPLAVLDWQWQRLPTGRYTLSYFKYIEDVNGSVRTVKEWTPEFIRTTVVDTEEDVLVDKIEEVNALGYIPAICAYNLRSPVRGIGISDIADIAFSQKHIYNCTSEAVESIRLDTHPSVVTTPDVNIGTGAGSLIHVPNDIEPGLKPYVLSFDGASIDSIYKSIEHTVASIDKMANTGSIRETESRVMSGISRETEFQLLNSRLSEKADAMELVEEQIWQIFGDYQNLQWQGEIDYPGSFNIRDTASEVEQLRIAKETATDPALVKAIDERLAQWMDVEVEFFEPHAMQDPETGVTRIVQTYQEHIDLANQGWTHPGE